MALSEKRRGRWWSRFHFGVRFLGLTGLLLVFVGLAVALIDGLLTLEVIRINWELLQSSVRQVASGEQVGEWPRVGLLLLGAGLVAGLFALLVEVLVVLRMVAGRRSAFGLNAFVQVALATVLLIGVNLYSAGCDIDLSGLGRLRSEPHFARLDTTRHQEFTLPAELLDNLRQLQGETTIIVYDRNRPFGKSPERQDAKDQAIQTAAERVVVDKLKDLMEQFGEQGGRYRESGAQFRVEVLDVDDENIEQRLKDLTDSLARKMVPADQVAARAAELRRTIEEVPENSIFIVAGDRVQRLSFNDFYYLDKQGSRQQDNLVLLYQGAEPLARKIMNVDEKKPVVGVLVIHEVLSTESTSEELSMAAVKRALAARGFEVRNIILKNWAAPGEPEPAVYTYDESRYERLDEQLKAVQDDIRDLERVVASLAKLVKQWKESTLAQLTEAYKDQLQGRQVSEAMRKAQLTILEQNLAIQEFSLTESKQEREAIDKQMAGLSVDRLAEQRRITDLKYKLDRELAECDLILVPRISLINVNLSWAVPYDVHLLQEAQVNAIKDYLKQGKPALFSFGPSSETPRQFGPPRGTSDGIDDLLAQLGFELNRQTVMFDVERKSFAELRAGLVVMGSSVEAPPLELDWKGSVLGGTALAAPEAGEKSANPVRQALRIAGSSLGQQGLNLRARHPRPVGFDRAKLKDLRFDPVFLATTASSWSETNPFPGREGIPRLDLPDEAKRSDPNAERRGPFAVGLAVETTVPRAWYASEKTQPADVRVAVLGHGHIFVDDAAEQSQGKELLLLTLTNWLLGRDDLLPRDDQPWSYPRVELPRLPDRDPWSIEMTSLVVIGLPLLLVCYLGAVVFLLRRVR